MDDSRPLVSVVIPTRERSETLEHTLRSALRQSASSYEVLVSDNASEDRTPDVVAAIPDPRLRYVRTERRLSMCDNWEFALAQARGRFIVYIGDDDAILPNGIDRLTGFIQSNPSRAYGWTRPLYRWPIDGQPAEATYIPKASPVRELDLVAMARFVIRHGGWRYYLLPGVYHAAVERDVLDAMGKETGRVFRSTQPDLITSMSVPAFVPRAVQLDRPVTLIGYSSRSNGASLIARDGQASLCQPCHRRDPARP
jgi:glycosyltransferase involved in cell wall biosynthesis